MAKFINPFTDVGFKIIFGQEMTKGLLIDFLNDLLVGERHIQDRCGDPQPHAAKLLRPAQARQEGRKGGCLICSENWFPSPPAL